MNWHWLTERRRRHILERPFPKEWNGILERNVAFLQDLDESEREHLRALVQVFIAEKHWEGCGGLVLDDEMKVTIAAEACRMILALDHSLFGDVESILVYPSAVVRPRSAPMMFGRGPLIETDGGLPIDGESMRGGPVVLAWDSSRRGARDAHGRNLVIHEFAHKIDQLNGAADGTPPLESASEARSWARVFSEAFLALRERVQAGEGEGPRGGGVLDAYGAKNEAEFFAVATEAFFERADALAEELPELYELMARFFRQDPRGRKG
jgi:Mlc titration factor MtfA (ptsG expression regulator)